MFIAVALFVGPKIKPILQLAGTKKLTQLSTFVHCTCTFTWRTEYTMQFKICEMKTFFKLLHCASGVAYLHIMLQYYCRFRIVKIFAILFWKCMTKMKFKWMWESNEVKENCSKRKVFFLFRPIQSLYYYLLHLISMNYIAICICTGRIFKMKLAFIVFQYHPHFCLSELLLKRLHFFYFDSMHESKWSYDN